MEEKALKGIAKGAGILLIGALLGKILGFMYRIIISRLGTETYGEISLALSLFSILSIIAILGLDTGVLRYVSLFNKEKKKEKIKGTIVFSAKSIFIISLILAALLFILSDWITNTFFHTSDLSIILKVIAIALPFESLKAVWTNTLKAFQKIEYDIYTRVIGEIILRIILTILFINLGLGILGASIAYAISIICSSCVLFLCIEINVFSIVRDKIKAIAKRKEILLYSIPLVFNNITIIVINAADSLMLGYFYNPTTVGIYNVAIPIAKLILIVPTALTGLYLPILATVQENKKEFEKIYYTITKWIFFINALSLAWLILYGKDLIIRFFTASYASAEIPLIILAIGYLINSCIYTSRDILLLFTKTKTIFKATIISCVANIFLNFILIPKYGMIGAALSTSSSLILLSLILFFKSKDVTKINPFRKRVIIGGILIFIASIITKYLTDSLKMNASLEDLLLSVLIVSTISGVLIIVTNTWEKEDKAMLKIILRKVERSLKWKT